MERSSEKMHCDKEPFNSLSISPGVYVFLCEEHYAEEMRILEVNDTTENLLMEWLAWGNTYASVIGSHHSFISLMVRTDHLLKDKDNEEF